MSLKPNPNQTQLAVVTLLAIRRPTDSGSNRRGPIRCQARDAIHFRQINTWRQLGARSIVTSQNWPPELPSSIRFDWAPPPLPPPLPIVQVTFSRRTLAARSFVVVIARRESLGACALSARTNRHSEPPSLSQQSSELLTREGH